MAEILGQFRWPFARKAKLCGPRLMSMDSTLFELQTAKQILSEIFEIDIQEVEEMIRERCETSVELEKGSQWPEILWIED